MLLARVTWKGSFQVGLRILRYFNSAKQKNESGWKNLIEWILRGRKNSVGEW